MSPVSMYHDKKHQPGQGQDRSELASSSIVIITYNIHSAMSDSRLEAIGEELSDLYWDILVLVETWRPERFEKLVTEAGNMFYGSGGIRGRCGADFWFINGILLRDLWLLMRGLES